MFTHVKQKNLLSCSSREVKKLMAMSYHVVPIFIIMFYNIDRFNSLLLQEKILLNKYYTLKNKTGQSGNLSHVDRRCLQVFNLTTAVDADCTVSSMTGLVQSSEWNVSLFVTHVRWNYSTSCNEHGAEFGVDVFCNWFSISTYVK